MKPYLFWLVFVVLLGFQCHQITSDDLDDDEDWEDDNDAEDEDESVVELVLNVWGKPQIAEAGQEETIGELADRTEQYMNDYVLYKEKMGKYRFECRNYDTRCSQWASKGDCESHYDYSKYLWALANLMICAVADPSTHRRGFSNYSG